MKILMLSDGGFNGIARCEDEHDLESKHIFEDLFQIPFRWGLRLRWKHWQCEELYADIDCHLLGALIMTLTLMTTIRIVELR